MQWECLETKLARRRERQAQWQRWFAWYPIKVGPYCVWLETVERKLYLGFLVNFWVYKRVGQ